MEDGVADVCEDGLLSQTLRWGEAFFVFKGGARMHEVEVTCQSASIRQEKTF